ncbi:MAG: hypothetical protein WDO70_12020 [Alphaproteobacteria bacterium]
MGFIALTILVVFWFDRSLEPCPLVVAAEERSKTSRKLCKPLAHEAEGFFHGLSRLGLR